jgi:hypothetical protein
MTKLLKNLTILTLMSTHLFISSALSEDKKPQPPQNSAKPIKAIPAPAGHRGWFVGVRGAYVPSIILEVGYEFNNTFKLRLMGQAGRYNRTSSVDGQRYNRIQFKPQKVGAMVDWHPWKNGLRATLGAAYNGDKINFTSPVSGTLLGFPAGSYGTLTASYKYRRAVAPYLGFGYDTGSLGRTGISLSADAGFWFQGKVRQKVTLTGTGQTNLNVMNNANAHAANLINRHRLFKTLPMVSVGIRYLI